MPASDEDRGDADWSAGIFAFRDTDSSCTVELVVNGGYVVVVVAGGVGERSGVGGVDPQVVELFGSTRKVTGDGFNFSGVPAVPAGGAFGVKELFAKVVVTG